MDSRQSPLDSYTNQGTPGAAFVRSLHPGMGQAVAERTVLRRRDDGTFESWGDVAERVARGNASLVTANGLGDEAEESREYEVLRDLVSSGAVLTSGRHLQHGDAGQASRNMEIFTNCSTAATSFLLFLFLLNGSGVGRCYDDDMMLVNWDDAPTVRCVIDEDHPDFDPSAHESARDARHKYNDGRDVLWFEVPDDREGWGQALELWEVAAFERVHRDKLLILDFSRVRSRGSGIAGMQGRPSSGPVPLMNAFAKAMTIRGAGLPRWKQAMYIDHYFAECVLVGGARRAARMSTKYWRDPTVLDFVGIKRPVEYDGMTTEEVAAYRADRASRREGPALSFLWSSNNSVAVDRDFWDLVLSTMEEARDLGYSRTEWEHAHKVFDAVTRCAYGDGTGEPGFVNVDRLVQNDEGWDDLYLGDWAGSEKYTPRDNTNIYLAKLARRAKTKRWHMITNPCGEIALNILGGYCVLMAVAPYLARPQWGEGEKTWHPQKVAEYREEWDDEVERAFRAVTRACVRVNTMDAVYRREVRRTNRIGPGIVGIHEWLWARFGLGFRDVLDPAKAGEFREVLVRMAKAVHDEAVTYSEKVGLPAPHTERTIPPGGTISKLFGLTEGAHLPPFLEFVRWVQFREDDPLVEEYRVLGYPVRELEQYRGHTVVGFPTRPAICGIGVPEGEIVLASEATPEEHFEWLRFLETNWIEAGGNGPGRGNQVSYTIQYRPDEVSYEEFARMVKEHQPFVRCCSVMPIEDESSYEYLPEEPVSRERYEEIVAGISDRGGEVAEDVGREHLNCEGGACPVEFGTKGEAYREVGFAL